MDCRLQLAADGPPLSVHPSMQHMSAARMVPPQAPAPPAPPRSTHFTCQHPTPFSLPFLPPTHSQAHSAREHLPPPPPTHTHNTTTTTTNICSTRFTCQNNLPRPPSRAPMPSFPPHSQAHPARQLLHGPGLLLTLFTPPPPHTHTQIPPPANPPLFPSAPPPPRRCTPTEYSQAHPARQQLPGSGVLLTLRPV